MTVTWKTRNLYGSKHDSIINSGRKDMEWITGRLKEPSTYAGVGVGVVGVGIVIDEPICVFIGIAAAILSFIIKEKGNL